MSGSTWERAEGTNKLWGHCGECGHAWVIAYLPMELKAAAKLCQAARCPYGHPPPVLWGKPKRRPASNEGKAAGGRARAASMTAEQRSDQARVAARARWGRMKEPGK